MTFDSVVEMDRLKKLSVHEEVTLENLAHKGTDVRRVPGGLIYTTWHESYNEASISVTSQFVPFNPGDDT